MAATSTSPSTTRWFSRARASLFPAVAGAGDKATGAMPQTTPKTAAGAFFSLINMMLVNACATSPRAPTAKMPSERRLSAAAADAITKTTPATATAPATKATNTTKPLVNYLGNTLVALMDTSVAAAPSVSAFSASRPLTLPPLVKSNSGIAPISRTPFAAAAFSAATPAAVATNKSTKQSGILDATNPILAAAGSVLKVRVSAAAKRAEARASIKSHPLKDLDITSHPLSDLHITSDGLLIEDDTIEQHDHKGKWLWGSAFSSFSFNSKKGPTSFPLSDIATDITFFDDTQQQEPLLVEPKSFKTLVVVNNNTPKDAPSGLAMYRSALSSSNGPKSFPLADCAVDMFDNTDGPISSHPLSDIQEFYFDDEDEL